MEHYAKISNNLPLTDGYYDHYKHVIIKNNFAHLNNNINGVHNNLFNLEQVIRAITKVKPDAAPGYDNIYNKHIIQN